MLVPGSPVIMLSSDWGDTDKPRLGGYVFKSEDPTGPDRSSLTRATLGAQLAAGLPVCVGEEASVPTRGTYRNTMVYVTVSADVRA